MISDRTVWLQMFSIIYLGFVAGGKLHREYPTRIPSNADTCIK